MGESVKVVKRDKGRKKTESVGEVNQGYSEIGGGGTTEKKKVYHQSFSTILV